jgi:hypothetical protein
MKKARNFLFKTFLFISVLVFFSCEKDGQVLFTVDADNTALFAKGSEAQEGTLNFSKPKKLEYRFADSFAAPPNSSLEIEYDITPPLQAGNENYSLVLKTGEVSWQLPTATGEIRYSLPIDESFNGRFNIELETGKVDKNSESVLRIRSVSFSERRFGFYTEDSGRFFITPFVYRQDDSYVIDIPASFRPDPLSAEIEVSLSSALETDVTRNNAALEFAGYRIETYPGTQNINISPALIFTRGQLVYYGDETDSFLLNVISDTTAFPVPIITDPALVFDWPIRNWRNTDYEFFRWSSFPELLIFDFADYAAQDRMLKRLAFFVEKAGFRGRLAPDSEIASLHAWNAHDYRAEDLARFFDLARRTNFPLLDDERGLERILIDNGIILEDQGVIAAGRGGIISISRQSSEYLRYRFMAHEGFHGLFFIDEDFRDFSRRRWAQLSSPAKRFILSFFEYQQYDVRDEYLLVNEFMAHVLQQAVSEAADYFGSYIPRQLESTWRASALPQKDEATGTWPVLSNAFAAEARAFSEYVNRRWSLAAGRAWSLRVD